MLNRIANDRLAKSFAKIKFKYQTVDWDAIPTKHIGIYIHVPFCEQLCAFCPFHKVVYKEELKRLYLKAIEKEIKERTMEGKVEWVYIGGGTPNLLTPSEIGRILEALREYVDLTNIGMEGNPLQFTPEYLHQIRELGVEKLSTGVESLKPDTLSHVNRAKADEAQITSIVELARKLGFSVNVDLMVGLPKQAPEDFLYDVDRVGDINPQQITTYPFMDIPGVQVAPEMNSKEMFHLIEQAHDTLGDHGYNRESIWVFSKTKKIYDSARDELVIDYLGFGAAAFSKVAGQQIVNPPLPLYLDMLQNGRTRAFQTTVDEKSENWRKFGHELYNLCLDPKVIQDMPRSIKFILSLLKLTGNVKGDQVTQKGRFFVHDLTKTIVESLPFPVSNPAAIINFEEYQKELQAAQELLRIREKTEQPIGEPPVKPIKH
ncbi:MAG: radical SAM protein [Candidatus Hermodarchaeota archaeon]|nr:radical SAM protein [Candidatus Hermodarchaeota archaeon]